MRCCSSVVKFTFVASIALSSQSPAFSAEPFKSEEVIAGLYQAIRNVFGDKLTDDKWLSLSLVGAVAEKNDPKAINDFANFCPDPSPVMEIFGNDRHLDSIYGKILQSLAAPLRDYGPDYYKAVAILMDSKGKPTKEYEAYNEWNGKYADAIGAYLVEVDSTKKGILLAKALKVKKDWGVFGYKSDIEKALLSKEYDSAAFSAEQNTRRKNALDIYRQAGMDSLDFNGDAFRSPLSEVSPPTESWDNDNGWLTVSYSSHDFSNVYSATSSSKSGFGGLNLGFVTVVAQGGGNKGNESRVTSVSDFSYTFQLKRVEIRRPWLDTEVFYEPGAWAWKVAQNTKEYPSVSAGLDADGKPVPSPSVTYDNVSIGCAMLPLEFVIARKRSVVVTMSNDDYKQITTSGSSGGGGSFGGIFGGGGKRSWTTTSVTETGNDTTFKVEDPNLAIIGMISKVIPALPVPNANDKWPADAWLPGQKP